MDRRTFVKNAAATAAVGAVGLWSGKAPAVKKTYKLKFGTSAPDGTPWADLLKSVKTEMEKASGGSLQMEIYLGVRGGETKLVESLQLGTFEAGGVTIGAIGSAVPDADVLELPYLFNNYAEVDHILQSALRKEFAQLVGEKGFVLAGWSENGFRSFGAQRAIRKPEDLKGMKMRSQPSKVHLKFWEALGAQAEAINNADALSALKNHVVDGFDNSPIYTLVGQWWTAMKTWSHSEHIYQPALVLFSKKFTKKLPPELQKIVADSMAGNVERNGLKAVRDWNTQVVDGFKEQGKEVVILTDAEKKAFAEATHGVHDWYAKSRKRGGQVLKKINIALATYRKEQARADGGTK